MPYPEDALATHEQLIIKTHPHWWYLAKAGSVLVLTVVVGTWLAVTIAVGFISTLIGLVILAEVVWLVERTLRWSCRYFVLTSDRVMSRDGIIAKQGIEIPLNRINTVMSSQGMFERLLGVGNLTIESASMEGSQRFNTVSRPSDIQKQIYVQMASTEDRRTDRMGQAMSTTVGAAVVAPPEPNVADQINALAALRDQGLITEAEFDAKKTELIQRL